jgi:hypothetical protein
MTAGFVFDEWGRRARTRDVAGLLRLYSDDATLESSQRISTSNWRLPSSPSACASPGPGARRACAMSISRRSGRTSCCRQR